MPSHGKVWLVCPSLAALLAREHITEINSSVNPTLRVAWRLATIIAAAIRKHLTPPAPPAAVVVRRV